METQANIYNRLAGWLLVLLGAILIGFGIYIIIAGGGALVGFALIPVILGLFPLFIGKSIIKNGDGAKIAGLVVSALATLTIGSNLLTKSSGPGSQTMFLMIGLLVLAVVVFVLLIMGMRKNKNIQPPQI